MDEKILNLLKDNQSGYISGEQICKYIGLSRAAIWKHIENLRSQGYVIDAMPHLGYRLAEIPDKLYADEIRWGLGTKIFGKEIFSYKEIASTNDAAINLANEGYPEGTVIFAESQTKGRGRINRAWASPASGGIYMSAIIRPDISPGEASKITLLCAVAIIGAIKNISGINCSIKWPNDIYFKDKKIGGILTEMSAEMDAVKFLIAGIGVNVNTPLSDLPDIAVSIKEIAAKNISRSELAKEILRQIEFEYTSFKQNGFSGIITRLKDLSATIGRHVKINAHGRIIEGQAIDIDEQTGGLLIRQDTGFIERVLAGDVVNVR